MYLLFKDFFIDQLSVEIILNHLSGNFITCMTNLTINNIFLKYKIPPLFHRSVDAPQYRHPHPIIRNRR